MDKKVQVNVPKEIPVTREGELFSDAFEDMRRRFCSSVHNGKCSFTSGSSTEMNLSLPQKSTVTDEGHQHVIRMNVDKFSEKDVTVKVNGNSISVEGNLRKEGSSSSYSNSFKSQFALEGDLDFEKTRSFLSPEGILTITVPKVQKKSGHQQVVIHNTADNNRSLRNFHQISTCSATNSMRDVSNDVSRQSVEHQSASNSIEALDKKFNAMLKEWEEEIRKTRSAVPDFAFVSVKEPDFTNDYFGELEERFRQEFKELLDRARMLSLDARPDKYMAVGSTEGDHTDKTSIVTQDDQCVKITINVQGFAEDDLRVKVNEDNHLVLEGHRVTSEDGCTSERTFRKVFSLPEFGNLEKAKATMSADGVLTLTVPKKLTSTTHGLETPYTRIPILVA